MLDNFNLYCIIRLFTIAASNYFCYEPCFPPTVTAQKLKFPFKDFFSKCDQIRRPADLVTFTEEILKGKLQFLCSDSWRKAWFITKVVTCSYCKQSNDTI